MQWVSGPRKTQVRSGCSDLWHPTYDAGTTHDTLTSDIQATTIRSPLCRTSLLVDPQLPSPN